MAHHEGYHSGHCWYYRLGGRILTPDEICKDAEERGQGNGDYHLCDQLNKMAEPRRSKEIIAAIEDCSRSQEQNIKRYVEVTKQVEYERRWFGPYVWDEGRMWNDPTTAAMLKHNHIFYTHATLENLKSLSRQMSLF